MTGDQRRHAGGPRSTSAATTTRVVRAEAGAAALETPSGTSCRVSNITGMTVAAISMITVPDTTGVNILRSREKPGSQQELNQGGDQNEARHRGGAGFQQGRNAHGYECPRRSHDQDVSSPDSPHPHGLEDRSDATDKQCREDAPRDVAIGLLGDPGHNDHGQHHRRHDDDGRLQARTEGYRRGRILIWLVAYVFAFGCQGLTLSNSPH